MMVCKNCNKVLYEFDNYCPSCGQKAVSKLDIKFIIGDFFQTIFNVDSKVFRSLKFLLFKPGFLTKEYIEGKRVNYLAPIRLYIALSFIFFFLISIINNSSKDIDDDVFISSINSVEQGGIDSASVNEPQGHEFLLGGEKIFVTTKEFKRMKFDGVLNQALDSLTKETPYLKAIFSRKLVLAELDGKGFADTLRDQLSLFLLLFLPFIAMLYSIVFRKSNRGIVGHIVFNLHLNSFLIFLLLIDLCVGELVRFNQILNSIWIVVIAIYSQFYIIRALMLFYNRSWWTAFYKYLLLIIGYILLGVIFLFVIIFSSLLMF